MSPIEPEPDPRILHPVRLRSVATQAPTSGGERAAPGSQRPERTVPPKTGRGSGSAGSSREDGSERPLPTESQLDAHRPRTQALLRSRGGRPAPTRTLVRRGARVPRAAGLPWAGSRLRHVLPPSDPALLGPGRARSQGGPSSGQVFKMQNGRRRRDRAPASAPAAQTPQSRGCRGRLPSRPPRPPLRRRRPGSPAPQPTVTLGRHLASVPLAAA